MLVVMSTTTFITSPLKHLHYNPLNNNFFLKITLHSIFAGQLYFQNKPKTLK
jgi:hypothetical protein